MFEPILLHEFVIVVNLMWWWCGYPVWCGVVIHEYIQKGEEKVCENDVRTIGRCEIWSYDKELCKNIEKDVIMSN